MKTRSVGPVVVVSLWSAVMLGAAAQTAAAQYASRTRGWDSPEPFVAARTSDGASLARGRLIVGVAAWAEADAVAARLQALGASVIGGVPRLAILHVALAPGLEERAEAQRCAALAGVRYAEPDGLGEGGGVSVGRAAAGGAVARRGAAGSAEGGVPNDPGFPSQWHLQNTGQVGGLPGADIEALPAWGIATGDASVLVAVLDTGTDFTHPEFAGRLVPGWDFVNEDDDPTATHPHGIWVAGMLAANADNGVGGTGIDHACRLQPVRILNSFNQGTVFDLVQALDFVTASEADIINMSLINYPGAASLKAALQGAAGAGKILVACGGNNGSFPGNADVSWPGASPLTISVAWTTNADVLSGGSSTGTEIDFAGPGDNVFTTSSVYDQLDVVSGSSFSCPLTSGVIALMRSMNPTLTQLQSYKLLQAGAEDEVGLPSQDPPGWDPNHGHGRLNARRTLEALCSCTGPQPLIVSPPVLSVTTGGTWVCDIDAGPECAGDPYLLLGSTSGSEPGFDFGGSHVPLNPDAYLHAALVFPNSGPIAQNLGVLDALGRARATVSLPPELWPAAGLVVHHAAVVFDGSQPHPFLAAPRFVTEAVAVRVGALPSVVFSDAFEAAAMDWEESPPASAWHVSSDGECGAAGQMLAFSQPENGCDYAIGNGYGGTALSPWFVLTGEWPYRLDLDMIRDVTGSDTTTIRILEQSGAVKPQVIDAALPVTPPGVPVHVSFEIPNSSKLVGRTVRIELAVQVKPLSAGGTGWMVDNVAVRNDGAKP